MKAIAVAFAFAFALEFTSRRPIMELVLQQKQTLNLVMTAELRQAINLLQYSTYDLYQYIQEQQAENPLIELVDHVQNMYTNRSASTPNYSNEFPPDPLDFTADDRRNLYDELTEQVNVMSLSEELYALTHYLIQNIDENGYLQVEITDVVAQLNVSSEQVEAGLKIIQQLEPIGIGGRNLAECLAIQAAHYYPEDEFLYQLITQDLERLANRQWEAIAATYECSLEDIQEAFTRIQTFDPKPGAAFATNSAEYIEPDVIVDMKDGKFTIQLNDSYIPEIRINRDYLPLIQQKNDMSSYINHQYKKFQWLKNSIEQRRDTILKITQAIINHQLDFFHYGFSRLKPLTLKNIADEIEMHESTVSRATMNKMIQTAQGTFDMRRLFATGLKRSDGSSTSQTTVKMILKEVIDQEDKSKPLSDQKIADYLKEEKEITISRRTVAKYREELNIPSSRQRRQVVRQ